MNKLNLTVIDNAKTALNNHPLLASGVMKSPHDVQIFMEYHVFAVWDFMCLAKSLQNHIVPSGDLWIPKSEHTIQAGRMINEIILGEETDINPAGGYTSHFDLYLQAMCEIGADTSRINQFIDQLQTTRTKSVNQLLLDIPSPSEAFVTSTLNFIATGKPHVIAAAFAFGRETVIPDMFVSVLAQTEAIKAPTFKYYLERHIEVDSGEHGPAALGLVEFLCGNDPVKIEEAQAAAMESISHRITFWTRVQDVIQQIQAIKR